MTALPQNSASRFRRASDRSAEQLGRALLGYLAVVTLIITLAPFRFYIRPVHGVTGEWDWPDIVMNIAMFVPLGFCYQLTRPAGSALRWPRVLALAAAMSVGIESAQLFEVARFSSPIDVLTNTAGALLGAWLHVVVTHRIGGAQTVRTMALELPLSGLVYLLVPLMWLIGLASDGGTRAWLTLPIVAFAAGIIGTIAAAYVESARRMTGTWFVVAVLGWYGVALMPGTIRRPDLLLAGAVIALGVAWLRRLATERFRDRYGSRRFELPTLRLLLPLFAAYLALSSLWPLDEATTAWHGMVALLAGTDPTTLSVFQALEHVAAFTLVGYIVAEFRGRELVSYRRIVWPVVLWGGGLALLLEGARGFHSWYGFSALMVLLTVGAAAYGGWLYQLQRQHVRALLTRRESPPAAAISAAQITSSDRAALEPAFP